MSQTWKNLGTGGSVLDARNGSGTGVDSNDATLLEPGTSGYVYLPGINATNNMAIPHVAGAQVGDTMTWFLDVDRNWVAQTGVNDRMASKSIASTAAGEPWSVWANGTTSMTLRCWVSDGTTTVVPGTTVSIASASGVQNGRLRLKAEYIRNTGSGQYSYRAWWSQDFTSALTAVSDWAQIGTTVTGTSIGATFDNSSVVMVGAYAAGANGPEGKWYGFAHQIGTAVPYFVLDADVIASGGTTNVAATTGQTVTINRASSGRKSVAVPSTTKRGQSVWLLGLDDAFEIADNDLLDFGPSDSLTIVAVARFWGAISNNSIVGKGTGDVSATMQGYQMFFSGGAVSWRFGDGTTRVGGLPSAAPTSGALTTLSLHRDVASDRAWAATNGAENSGRTTDTTTGTLASSAPLRIGGAPATGFTSAEIFAVLVFRRALTSTEITAISDYYAARIP